MQQTKISRLILATDCNIDNRTLTTLAKRGKLIITSSRCDKCSHRRKPCTGCKEQEYIDLAYKTADGIELNREFYERHTEKREPASKIIIPKNPVGRPATPPEERKRQRDERVASVNPVEKSIQSKISEAALPVAYEDLVDIEINERSSEALLTKINKLRTIQEKEVTIRIKEMEEKRIRGESLPTKITEELVNIMAESMKRSYTDANENLIIIMADRLGAQAHDTAFMRKKSTEAINKAIDDSVDLAKSRVIAIIGEAKENG